MDCHVKFLVDGPCHVLFPWELKQPGVSGYFCGLCGARGFCTQYYGPSHICSHLLRSLPVADGWNLVCYTKYQRFSEVRTSLPSNHFICFFLVFYPQHYARWNCYVYHIDLEKKLLHISALIWKLTLTIFPKTQTLKWCNSSCEYLRQVSKFHREVLHKWIPEAVNLRRTPTHKECICREFSLQTRLGGEICSSDVIMHKGPLSENHFLVGKEKIPAEVPGKNMKS